MRYDNYLARQLRKWQETVWCVNIFREDIIMAKKNPIAAAAKKMAAGIAMQAPIAVRNCKKAINEGLQVDMDQAIVIEEKLFGDCFETEDQKAGMGNFLEKDKEKKLKVVPFQNK